jgi:hypothetical protein
VSPFLGTRNGLTPSPFKQPLRDSLSVFTFNPQVRVADIKFLSSVYRNPVSAHDLRNPSLKPLPVLIHQMGKTPAIQNRKRPPQNINSKLLHFIG